MKINFQQNLCSHTFSFIIKDITTHIEIFNYSENEENIPLIFCHGWGGSTQSFEKLTRKILEKTPDQTIVLIDFPGFGLSGFPPAEGWNTEEYAEFLCALLDKLDIARGDFYGHSFGCRVLVRFLQKYSQRARKILLTGAAGISLPKTRKQKMAIFLRPVGKILQKIIPSKIYQKILTKVFGARDWAAVAPPLKPTLKKVLDEADFRKDLENISQETLLLWGEKDRLTPLLSGKVFHKFLPQSQLITYPSGRHGIHHTHTEEISDRVVHFLKK